MLPPRAIRALYRFQQQVGLTAAEFRAVCALSLVLAAGLIVDAVRHRPPEINRHLYAAEDSLFAEAIRRQQAFELSRESTNAFASLRERTSAEYETGVLPRVTPRDTIDARLDLNGAGREALLALPRIGPAIAERILDWRQQFGPFLSVDDLEMVRGIGPATLEKLRPLVRVDPVAKDTAQVEHPRD